MLTVVTVETVDPQVPGSCYNNKFQDIPTRSQLKCFTSVYFPRKISICLSQFLFNWYNKYISGLYLLR